MITTGKKERLSIRKGSEIEFSVDGFMCGDGNAWYCGILEQNLSRSKKTSVSVRHLDPLLKQDFSPPIIKTTLHCFIRPVPPPDPFPDVGFKVGDVIDAVHDGCWWPGSVIKVLRNQRYFVYLKDKPGAIEIERKNLRPHMIWECDEWFRCEKRPLVEADFSKGKSVEVRTEVDNLGDVWSEATVIKENEDGTLLVKLWSFDTEESFPYSKIRPSQPGSSGIQTYKLMEKVESCVNHRWCPGLVSKLPHGDQYHGQYVVVLGPNKESKKFYSQQLRHSLEWKDGVWFREEKVLETEESPHEGKKTPNALATDQEMRETHSSGDGAMGNPSPTSSYGVDVAETGNVSVAERETMVLDTGAHLTGELRSKLSNAAIQENTPVTRQPEIGGNKEFHSPVDLGIDATQTKPVVKTYLRKKLQGMKNLKGSANDGEKEPEKTKDRENLRKRKGGQAHNLISTETKQKTGMAATVSKAATAELANVTDDDRPLASWIHGEKTSSGLAGLSAGQYVCRSPQPMLNSVVEKHVVETTPARESTMVLPFVKKSPIWKVLESMEIFEAVPQHPHFTPLLESVEESREGEAIGQMVMYTGLLEKLNNLQVDELISSIIRIDECLLTLEKHGFNVREPRSRIAKILSIKETQTRVLEEFKSVEEKIRESDSKRRKYEEDIVELQTEFERQEAVLKEAKVRLDKEIAQKVRLDKEIAQMQSNAAVLDQKVKNVDQELRAIVAVPW